MVTLEDEETHLVVEEVAAKMDGRMGPLKSSVRKELQKIIFLHLKDDNFGIDFETSFSRGVPT